MGILNLKPFLIKKGIGTNVLSITQLKQNLQNHKIVVDVFGCHYFAIRKCIKLPMMEQIHFLIKILSRFYFTNLNLEKSMVLFVFDGELDEAKRAEKTKRSGSDFLRPMLIVYDY